MAEAQLRVQASQKLAAVMREALMLELSVSQHYWGMARVWVRVPRLAEMYAKEADEEREHARLIADRAVFLNLPVDLQTEPERNVGFAVTTCLTADLGAEVAVSERYVEFMRVALEAEDHVTYEILRKIQEQTEEHVHWLQKQLKLIEEIGEQNYLQAWM